MAHSPYSLHILLSSSEVNTPRFEDGPTYRKAPSRPPSRTKIENAGDKEEKIMSQENGKLTLQEPHDNLLKLLNPINILDCLSKTHFSVSVSKDH